MRHQSKVMSEIRPVSKKQQMSAVLSSLRNDTDDSNVDNIFNDGCDEMSLSQTENILKDISNNEASSCSAVSASQSTTKLVQSDTVKIQNSAKVQGQTSSFSFITTCTKVLSVSFHCLGRYFQSGVIERH